MVFPTKSNLLQSKRSLALAKTGYELLDRKRNIMLREIMSMIDQVHKIQSQIDTTFSYAYAALEDANISLGQSTVSQIAEAMPESDDVTIRYRSVMGIELPDVIIEQSTPTLSYGLSSTTEQLDRAYFAFLKVKKLTAQLASIENSVYRLANSIKKSQKRANALKNIVIPRLEETVHYITGYLEEKEREEFTAQKVIKNKLSSSDI